MSYADVWETSQPDTADQNYNLIFQVYVQSAGVDKAEKTSADL